MQNLKISTKLLVTALAIGFIPMAIIGGFALFESRNVLSNQIFNQLSSIRDVKKANWKHFLQNVRTTYIS